MVISREIPLGLIANTAAVLGMSLSQLCKETIIGPDITDGSGQIHRGITSQAIPVLSAAREQLKALRDKIYDSAYSDVTVIDFSEVAQKCLDYDHYTKLLAAQASSDLYYLGVCVYGPTKKINKLTGSLSLLR